ncbi:universal stress protein [Mycobacterium sp. Y57]|uniref:universal stress protein n=1 Tax=Mycolicibacterium xanthum TaxID=2796469 RepID=UPI001C8528FA|nr:universal stress protein [Mycolicibacterium xanthum]MBX7434587.1 universal stress protein [Mycolicibacterium xanthum]
MRLMVGYLATPGGADALALGVRLARTLSAEVEICLVLPHGSDLGAVVATGGYEEQLGHQAHEWLADALDLVPEDIVAHCHVNIDDSFAEGLIDAAVQLEAVAIVVGGSGGGLSANYTLGPVVNELLHASPVPVVVAPRGARDSKIDRVRTVTCAIGEREGADLLLETAFRASEAAGTPLRLVSLVALDPVPGAIRGDDEAVRHRAVEHAFQTLDAAKKALRKGFPVTANVADGGTVEQAVKKLDWHDGDLIMVGSSRLGTARRTFLGSTAAKMLRALDVPMVVVPKAEIATGHIPQ